DYPELRASRTYTKGGPIRPAPMMAGPMANLMTGPVAAGGLAVMRVRLLPDAGSPRNALLRVNCAKGKVPENEASDGVQLTFAVGPVFDRRVSGKTVFLLRRPVLEFTWKNSAPVGAER